MDEKHFQLLDYGVNYAASVDTQNAFVYAVKGLVGLFPGRFNSIPYYYKVREYNDFESRDLWEYDLSLTPAQVAMLVAHVWELGSTQFPYYYVSRNCSYHLIAALEAAVPELDLLSHVGHVAVPADTIKVLHEMPGLVRTVRYRPSVRAQFRRRAQDLSGRQLDEVEKLADAPQTALPGQPAEQASVLDAALELVDLRHARGRRHPARQRLRRLPRGRARHRRRGHDRIRRRASDVLCDGRQRGRLDAAVEGPERCAGADRRRSSGGRAAATRRVAGAGGRCALAIPAVGGAAHALRAGIQRAPGAGERNGLERSDHAPPDCNRSIAGRLLLLLILGRQLVLQQSVRLAPLGSKWSARRRGKLEACGYVRHR